MNTTTSIKILALSCIPIDALENRFGYEPFIFAQINPADKERAASVVARQCSFCVLLLSSRYPSPSVMFVRFVRNSFSPV